MKFRSLITVSALAVALGLTACGGGGGNTSNGGGGANALAVGTGTEASLEFMPKTITAPANTPVTLTFTNNGILPHDLKFQEGITAGTSDNVAAGASETISFTTPGPGTYKFVCIIHPGMEGTLTVQ